MGRGGGEGDCEGGGGCDGAAEGAAEVKEGVDGQGAVDRAVARVREGVERAAVGTAVGGVLSATGGVRFGGAGAVADAPALGVSIRPGGGRGSGTWAVS